MYCSTSNAVRSCKSFIINLLYKADDTLTIDCILHSVACCIVAYILRACLSVCLYLSWSHAFWAKFNRIYKREFSGGSKKTSPVLHSHTSISSILDRFEKILFAIHCVKCPYLEFFWSVYSRIWNEYGEILQSKYGKIRTRKAPILETFHTVNLFKKGAIKRKIEIIVAKHYALTSKRKNFQMFLKKSVFQ